MFQGGPGIHIWTGTTPLFEIVNPQQAEAARTHQFMAPQVPPLCFPHEDKEVEMYPACFCQLGLLVQRLV